MDLKVNQKFFQQNKSMKKNKFQHIAFILALLFFCFSCKTKKENVFKGFVKIKDTHFEIDGKPYYFIGTNFWYGINLGSQGTSGDRERLVRELDRLQKLGITNLRIMGLTEGPDTEPYRMVPSVQTTSGEYNEDLLTGLDFLLSEMKKRNMYGVICLNNFWPWSGGMAQYLVWNNYADSIPYPPPHPGGSWSGYQEFTSAFYSSPKAVAHYKVAIKKIITRTNSITQVPYIQDPTIMSWQLCNEPRGDKNIVAFNTWIDSTAYFIKQLDSLHLVTSGIEGYTPDPASSGTDFIKNHESKYIDYATAHIWAQNWEWYDPLNHSKTYDTAVSKMKHYFARHVADAIKINKPLVIEEFGIGRDKGEYDPSATVLIRDDYYAAVFSEAFQYAQKGNPVAGINFWAWGGEGRPLKPGTMWKPGDNFIGDPPHEGQGWYSVYDKDSTTLKVIKDFSDKMNSLNK